ncbi:MAG: phosphatidylglycerol lysyltransferase domain-containing protein, partial [Methylomonas sp.]
MTEPVSNIVDLVRQYGGPMSHSALIPSICHFRTPAIEGLISHWQGGRCAVVMGDPICAPGNKAALARAFEDHCADEGWSIVYIAATASVQAYARQQGYTSMEFASLLMAAPQDDPEIGPEARHLRQHLNHTRRTGVIVREYQGEPDAETEIQVQAVCDAWLGGRRGPQMYLGRPRLFDERLGRRWFIAEQAGKVIGYLSMLRIGSANSGNLINLVFSAPDAPLYTNELMVVTALQALREEGAGSVCLGVGPLRE